MIERLRQQIASQPLWFFAIVAISLTPLVQGLLTTTFDGYVTYPQSVIRVLSVVTILTEMLIVAIALQLGFPRYVGANVKKRTKIAFLLFLISAMIPVFAFNTAIIFSLFITLRFFLQLAALFCLTHILSSGSAFDVKRYFAVMAAGLFLYVAYLILIIAMIPDYATFYWLSGLPSATNIRHIGNYVAILTMTAIGTFLLSQSRFRWLVLVVIFVVTVFLAWTGSRAAFVGIGVALPVALFPVRRDVSLARVGILLATLAAALVAAVPLPKPDPSFGMMRMISASDTRQTSDISSARTAIWQHTTEEIAQAPLFGHGAGRFLGNMDAKYKYDLDNPHNFILQFGYDWGIIGAVIALVLLTAGGVRLTRLPVVSPLATFCAVSGLMLMLSIGLIEGMFYHPLKMLLVSALVAPAFALARRS